MKEFSIESAVEAIIFSSEEPVKEEDIEKFFRIKEDEFKNIIERLKKKYNENSSSIALEKIGGGYRFIVKEPYVESVKRFLGLKLEFKFSKAILETLSIVAYKQPVTIKEISMMRGTNSSYTVKQLLQAGLIKISGRKKAPGNPLLFSTTKKFLETFNINSLEELPTVEELEELFKEN